MESSLERHVSHALRVHPRPRIVLFDLRVHKGLSGRKGQQTYPPPSILGFFTAVHANASAIAGALASVAHDAVMTPLDVVKQRMQLGLYPRPYVAFRSILKNEGFGALYASYFTTILMNIPNAAVLVVTNDWMKSVLNPSGNQVGVAHRVDGRISLPSWSVDSLRARSPASSPVL